MECQRIKQLLDLWESTGQLTAVQLQIIIEHINVCHDGCSQYTLVLPFLQKDAGLQTDSLTDNPEVIPSVAAGTLQRIMRLPDQLTARKRFPRWLPAAAMLVFILGVAFFFTGRNITSGTGEMLVQFELKAAEAQSVYLVGDFSNWDPLEIPLDGPDHEGIWKVKVRLKKNRSYNYNFLINGDIWLPDPTSEFTVDDGFGGINSVINL